jgi:uncharacterized membrane protein YqiK
VSPAWTAVLCAAGVALAVVGVGWWSWRVPGPDQALVVTGRRPRVVRAYGALVVPGVSRVARIDLGPHPVEVDADGRSAEGIACTVGLRATWRVADGDDAVTRAARHLTACPGLAARQVAEAVAGRARAAVGATPAADLVGGAAPDRVGRAVAAGVATDLAGLGLSVDLLHVTAIGDPTGHLADLVAPGRARAAAARRIAEAEADAAAVAAERAAETARARAERDLRLVAEPGRPGSPGRGAG